MDEKDLISRLNIQDESAMQELFYAWHAKMCIIAWRIVKDREQAKDIVQEVFIKLWRNAPGLAITTSLEAYLKRAVVNTSLNHIEARNRFTKLKLEDAAMNERAVGSAPLDLDELTRLVNEAISQLPPRTRTVFSLIRSEDMSYREVAAALGISLKAVEKEMLKALKMLRAALRNYLAVLLMLLHRFLE